MNTWITDELKIEVKKTFEPRYGRGLQDNEVVEIATNLAEFVEHLINYKTRSANGKS